MPPAETIETVTVSTSAFEADQGMAGGASIQVITKPGTNNLKGPAFYSHSNDSLDARTWQSKRNNTPESPSKFNNGALRRRRSHPEEQAVLLRIVGRHVPARRRARSDLDGADRGRAQRRFQRGPQHRRQVQAIYDPRTGNADGSGRTQFPGNRIPADRMQRAVAAAAGSASDAEPAGHHEQLRPRQQTEFTRNIFDVKVNWNTGPSQQWWAKVGAMDADVQNLVLHRRRRHRRRQDEFLPGDDWTDLDAVAEDRRRLDVGLFAAQPRHARP